jgi:hypothetical protein
MVQFPKYLFSNLRDFLLGPCPKNLGAAFRVALQTADKRFRSASSFVNHPNDARSVVRTPSRTVSQLDFSHSTVKGVGYALLTNPLEK